MKGYRWEISFISHLCSVVLEAGPYLYFIRVMVMESYNNNNY